MLEIRINIRDIVFTLGHVSLDHRSVFERARVDSLFNPTYKFPEDVLSLIDTTPCQVEDSITFYSRVADVTCAPHVEGETRGFHTPEFRINVSSRDIDDMDDETWQFLNDMSFCCVEHISIYHDLDSICDVIRSACNTLETEFKGVYVDMRNEFEARIVDTIRGVPRCNVRVELEGNRAYDAAMTNDKYIQMRIEAANYRYNGVCALTDALFSDVVMHPIVGQTHHRDIINYVPYHDTRGIIINLWGNLYAVDVTSEELLYVSTVVAHFNDDRCGIARSAPSLDKFCEILARKPSMRECYSVFEVKPYEVKTSFFQLFESKMSLHKSGVWWRIAKSLCCA